MPQIITIECTSCEAVAKEETDRCILIVWRGQNIGLMRHDVVPNDLLEAAEQLIGLYREEQEKEEEQDEDEHDSLQH